MQESCIGLGWMKVVDENDEGRCGELFLDDTCILSWNLLRLEIPRHAGRGVKPRVCWSCMTSVNSGVFPPAGLDVGSWQNTRAEKDATVYGGHTSAQQALVLERKISGIFQNHSTLAAEGNGPQLERLQGSE